MQESDQFPGRSLGGFLVYQSDSRGGGLLELFFHVIASKGDVMNAARRILLQEFGDGTLRVRRFQQFQMHFADGEKGGAHLLLGNFLAMLAL